MFGHFMRLPLGCLPWEVFPTCTAQSIWNTLTLGGETISHSIYTPQNPLVDVYVMLSKEKGDSLASSMLWCAFLGLFISLAAVRLVLAVTLD